MHASRATEVAAARQRLLLFGLSPDQVAQLRDASHVVSEVTVHAPGDGVVIARAVNPGQVVPSGQELFMVTDLKTVWVIGDLYEKDFATVRVGSPATVMVTSASDRQLRGRVAYIDPRVDPATRTAKVRIEVPNVSGDLRLGMFVNVSFETGGPRMTLVPRSAVQSIGDRSVVYVPADGEEGRFIERTVKLGRAAGDVVEVLAGLKPGVGDRGARRRHPLARDAGAGVGRLRDADPPRALRARGHQPRGVRGQAAGPRAVRLSAFDKRAPASIAFVREAICIANLSTRSLIHGGNRWTNLTADQLWRSD